MKCVRNLTLNQITHHHHYKINNFFLNTICISCNLFSNNFTLYLRRGYKKKMNILKISRFPDFIQCFPDFSQPFSRFFTNKIFQGSQVRIRGCILFLIYYAFYVKYPANKKVTISLFLWYEISETWKKRQEKSKYPYWQDNNDTRWKFSNRNS